jgi:predicted dehydrogenase
MDVVRWGVVGAGGIAGRFAADVARVDGAVLAAVGSRRSGGTQAFDVPHRFEGPDAYAELCASDAIDAVYVATPHPYHLEHGLLAVRAGKPVLVEKPFTMDADEARTLVAEAAAAGVFCMEAMWTRFLPHMARVRDLLAAGAIGEPLLLHADQGMWFEPDAGHRLFAPELGGGALLDLGVYPFSFASMVLGPPSGVHAAGTPAFTGVDLVTSATLTYPSGAQAVLTCTSGAATPMRAWIAGAEGRIELDSRWYQSTAVTLVPRTGAPQRFEAPDGVVEGSAKGMQFEIAEAVRGVREGWLESPLMPLAETVAVMATLDEVRRQIDLTYPRRPTP